jgi:hypothetical protein
MSNQPETKFRAGAVAATVWKNDAVKADGTKGEFFTVSLERNYRDKDGNWKTSSSMRVNDLPKAALVLQKAYEHCILKEQSSGTEVIEELMPA